MSDKFKISDMELESDAPDPLACPEDGKSEPEFGSPRSMEDMSLGMDKPTGDPDVSLPTGPQVNQKIVDQESGIVLKGDAYDLLRVVSEGHYSWDGKLVESMNQEEIKAIIPHLWSSGIKVT